MSETTLTAPSYATIPLKFDRETSDPSVLVDPKGRYTVLFGYPNVPRGHVSWFDKVRFEAGVATGVSGKDINVWIEKQAGSFIVLPASAKPTEMLEIAGGPLPEPGRVVDYMAATNPDQLLASMTPDQRHELAERLRKFEERAARKSNR